MKSKSICLYATSFFFGLKHDGRPPDQGEREIDFKSGHEIHIFNLSLWYFCTWSLFKCSSWLFGEASLFNYKWDKLEQIVVGLMPEVLQTKKIRLEFISAFLIYALILDM